MVELEPESLATYDAYERPHCLEGTRVNILNEIISWVYGGSTNVFWLNGAAGAGKSTIAQTLADYFIKRNVLGAYVFCMRMKSDPKTLLRTLAYQLACFKAVIAYRMRDATGDTNVVSATVETQFEMLFKMTLAKAAEHIQGPVVIILDGLDECGTSVQRQKLMKVLSRLGELPKQFRFLITSRPEEDIKNTLSSLPATQILELDPTSSDSQQDVQMYLGHALSDVFTAEERMQLSQFLQWEPSMKVLGEAAGGLFIWASTVVNLVSGSTLKFGRLQELISAARLPQGPNFLDALYTTALEASMSRDQQTMDLFRRVMSLVLFSKTPLSDTTIDSILGLAWYQRSAIILSKLRSLVAYKPGVPVRLYHTSFYDFLTTADRCGEWLVDIVHGNSVITYCSLNVMTKSLHFNMGDLDSSFIRDDAVEGLAERIAENIPPDLDYVCHHWTDHLRLVPFSPDLLDMLTTFVLEQLLYWFEVLSLTGTFHRVAKDMLRDAIAWLPVRIPLYFA